MRIMPDTNVIISALLWPDSKPARALVHAALYHELLLCDHIVQEVREVVLRKWPHLLRDADALLDELAYDLLAAPQEAKRSIVDVPAASWPIPRPWLASRTPRESQLLLEVVLIDPLHGI